MPECFGYPFLTLLKIGFHKSFTILYRSSDCSQPGPEKYLYKRNAQIGMIRENIEVGRIIMMT